MARRERQAASAGTVGQRRVYCFVVESSLIRFFWFFTVFRGGRSSAAERRKHVVKDAIPRGCTPLTSRWDDRN
jgi:hypothetical protein